MPRHVYLWAVLSVFLVALLFNSTTFIGERQQNTILVSVQPQRFIVERIVQGSGLNVMSLVDDNKSSHHDLPDKQHIIKHIKNDPPILWWRTDPSFPADIYIEKHLKQTPVISTKNDTMGDHPWISPSYLQQAIAQIGEYIDRITNFEHTELIQKNTLVLQEELSQKIIQWEHSVKNADIHALVSISPILDSIARHFNMKHHFLSRCHDEPSHQQYINFINELSKDPNLKLFVDKKHDKSKLLKALTSNVSTAVIAIDVESYDIFDVIDHIVHSITQHTQAIGA